MFKTLILSTCVCKSVEKGLKIAINCNRRSVSFVSSRLSDLRRSVSFVSSRLPDFVQTDFVARFPSCRSDYLRASVFEDGTSLNSCTIIALSVYPIRFQHFISQVRDKDCSRISTRNRDFLIQKATQILYHPSFYYTRQDKYFFVVEAKELFPWEAGAINIIQTQLVWSTCLLNILCF